VDPKGNGGKKVESQSKSELLDRVVGNDFQWLKHTGEVWGGLTTKNEKLFVRLGNPRVGIRDLGVRRDCAPLPQANLEKRGDKSPEGYTLVNVLETKALKNHGFS